MSEYIVRQGLHRRLRSDFLALPTKVYRNDPNYVPPLASEMKRTLDVYKNPFFHYATQQRFVCYRNGVPVARTLVVIDPKQRVEDGRHVAFFGFFEAIEDERAVKLLFSAAEEFAAAHGATHLDGPFNPNHYSELGLKIDQFGGLPHFFEMYNPEYYLKLLDQSGFTQHRLVRTFSVGDLPVALRERYKNPPPVQPPYIVRHIRMDDLKHDMEQIREIYNDSFATNGYYHDVSQDEYKFLVKYLKYITKPELTTIVEKSGEPIAVIQFAQDVNPLLQRMGGKAGPLRFLRYERDRKRLRSGVMYAIGIKKEYQCSFVFGLLMRGIIEVRNNLDDVTTTWNLISEENSANLDMLRRLGCTPDRSFAILRKELYAKA